MLVVLSALIAVGCGGENALGTDVLDPAQTVTISGVQWAPPQIFNPFLINPSAGIDGLVYEQLFHFNVQTGRFVPWLAESGEWLDKTHYRIVLRDGIRWTDGRPATVEDLIFTYEIARDVPALQYSSIWDWIIGIEKTGERTIVISFNNPRYHKWDYWLCNIDLVPKHVWENKSADEIMGNANPGGVSSGPYRFGRALEDRMILVRNDDWWGNDIFGAPAPKYVVFPIVTSNSVALGSVMKGEIDLCNNFLPGLEKIKDQYGLITYYQDPPYNLPANVAILFLNSRTAPLDNPMFRRALAYAINSDHIVTQVYGGQVQRADPTGLINLPAWQRYRSEASVRDHGFSYDPRAARQLLDRLGLVDVNQDGFREDTGGRPIEFSIIVPNGWTDWMESIRLIAADLEAVGINAVAEFPDFSVYWDKLTSGAFDMAINNFNTKISATPFTYWHCVAYNEIDREKVEYGNYGRYGNPELFEGIDRFNLLEKDTPESLAAAARIQTILLEEMPSIPLWYNGFWGACSSRYWTGWPTEDNPRGVSTGWTDFWQLGALQMLLNLKPAEK